MDIYLNISLIPWFLIILFFLKNIILLIFLTSLFKLISNSKICVLPYTFMLIPFFSKRKSIPPENWPLRPKTP